LCCATVLPSGSGVLSERPIETPLSNEGCGGPPNEDYDDTPNSQDEAKCVEPRVNPIWQ
jgi:hypothetical protein